MISPTPLAGTARAKPQSHQSANRSAHFTRLGLPQDVDDLFFTESTFSHVLLLAFFAAELQECHIQRFGVRSLPGGAGRMDGPRLTPLA